MNTFIDYIEHGSQYASLDGSSVLCTPTPYCEPSGPGIIGLDETRWIRIILNSSSGVQ